MKLGQRNGRPIQRKRQTALSVGGGEQRQQAAQESVKEWRAKSQTDQFMKMNLKLRNLATKFSKNGPRRSWANPKGKSVKPCFRPQVLWYEVKR